MTVPMMQFSDEALTAGWAPGRRLAAAVEGLLARRLAGAAAVRLAAVLHHSGSSGDAAACGIRFQCDDAGSGALWFDASLGSGLVERLLGSHAPPSPMTMKLSAASTLLVRPLLLEMQEALLAEWSLPRGRETERQAPLPGSVSWVWSVEGVVSGRFGVDLAAALAAPVLAAGGAAPAPLPEVQRELLGILQGAAVALSVELGQGTASMAELDALAPGDVICLEQPVAASLRIFCGDRVVAAGRPVSIDGQLHIVMTTLAPEGGGR